MYEVDKRMLKKGQIISRPSDFYLKAYEYSFRAESHAQVASHFKNRFDELHARNMKYAYDSESHSIILGSLSWRVEIQGREERDGFVSYILLIISWEERYNRLGLGDWINVYMTEFEKIALMLDPYAWVREVPVKTKLTNGIGSLPERWMITSMDLRLTREAAAEKKLWEGYLADRLAQMGVPVRGGTVLANQQGIAAPKNPIVEQKIAENNEKQRQKEETAAQAEADRIAENARRAAAGEKSLEEEEEEKRQQKLYESYLYPTMKQYPFFFLTDADEETHPYIHARINAAKELKLEPEDGTVHAYVMNGMRIYRKSPQDDNWKTVYDSYANHDHILYVTDSRIAVINPKYNQDKSVGWIGMSGTLSQVVASGMTWAGRAIRAGLRAHKAMAGHIRYEWNVLISYKHKDKVLGDESIRIAYTDIDKSAWMVELLFSDSRADAEALANEILLKTVQVRNAMTDEKSDEEKEFFREVLEGMKIPQSADPSRRSTIKVPGSYSATAGAKFRNMSYLPEARVRVAEEMKKQGQAVPSAANAPATAQAQPDVTAAPTQAPAASAPAQAPKFCGKCGTPAKPGARFCHKCGNQIG